MTMPETLPRVALLQRVADTLPGPDGDWLRLYLDPFADCALDEAAGLIPAPGEKHWRTVARRALRDDAIRSLAAYFPGLSGARCAAEISRMLVRYAASRWQVDQARPLMPGTYISTPDEFLYAALRAGGGRVPGVSRIRQVLSICTPVFIDSQVGDISAHGTDQNDSPRDRRARERS